MKDRIKDKDLQLSKLEQERNASQKAFQKQLQEKDAAWTEKLENFEQEKQDQLRKLEERVKK